MVAACAKPSLPRTRDLAAAAPTCRSTAGPDQSSVHVVRWVEANDPEDRPVLNDWCRTVGPPMYVESTPVDPVRRSLDRIAVVSWNVHVGGGDLAALVDALRAGQITDGVPVADFVLLLQEAFRASPLIPVVPKRDSAVPPRIEGTPPTGERQDITTAAAALGLFSYYVPSMRNGERADPLPEDRGNAILSTRPLSSLTAIELPFEHQRRVALTATIDGENAVGTPWQIRVATLHPDATAGKRHLWLFASGTRARQ